MRFPILLLVLGCLVVGIVPGLTIGPYLRTAVVSVLGAATPDYSLAVWHGFTIPLAMSTVALVGGAIVFLLLKHYLAQSPEGPPILRHLNGQRLFERVLVTVSWRWARSLETVLGTRRLQPQLRLLVLVATLASAWALYRRGFDFGQLTFAGADPVFALLWAIGIACALGAAVQAKFHRLAALILLGGAGLVTCATFVWLSAPDLAVTQLLVEVVTTVLILLGLRWLPKRFRNAETETATTEARLRRFRDLALAVAAGTGVALIAYAATTQPVPHVLADYFLRHAFAGGGGHNVVNVILVDFRGFDTMGEITVLGIVAVTVFALLRRFRPAPDSIDLPEQQRTQNANDEARPGRTPGDTANEYILIPAVIMQWLFPVVIVFAVYLFLRGHDLPGGGFAAGIAMAAGFILQYMAVGTRRVEDRLRILPVRWIGLGLLLAVATGAGSWLFGYPFLTSHAAHFDLPLIGSIPAASATLFDLGVFTLVVGATVLMLIALAHQSVRSHRAARIAADEDDAAWN
jgi:multicomponent K+:H+ antiporter subunit A